MKRFVKAFSVFFSSLLVIPVLSCTLINDARNFEKPESVTLKSSGSKYSVPLGKATAYLSDHVTPEKLAELIAQNSKVQTGTETKIEVYDFNDIKDQTVQKFIFNYPVEEIPLDMSAYLSKYDQLDITDGSKNSLSQTFKIALPESTFTKDIDIDFDTLIRDSIDCEVSNIQIPQTESDDPEPFKVEDIWVTFTEPEFSSIEFKSGSLVLNLTEAPESNSGDGVNIFIKATLNDKNGEYISDSGEVPVSVYSSGLISPLYIPMDDKVLTNKVFITFDVYSHNGELGKFNVFNMSLALSDDAKIGRITDLTVKDSDLEPYYISLDETLSTADLRTMLKTAEISDGAVNYCLKLPAGWSGVTAEPSVAADGDLIIAPGDFVPVEKPSFAVFKTASLAGKTITPASGIHFSGTVPFKIKNATIVVDGAEKLKFYGEAVINKLNKAEIYADQLVDPETLKKDISVALGEDVKTYVESITFEKVGLEGTVKTNLPASDLVLTAQLTSEFFGMSKNDSIKFNEPEPHTLLMTEVYDGGLVKQLTSDIDFKIDMQLTGSESEDPSVIVLNSLETNKDYSFIFDVNLVYDWSELVLITDSRKISGTMDSGFNFKAILGDSLADTSGIEQVVDNTMFQPGAIEGRFYVTRPDLENLEDFSGFDGALKCDYGDGEKYLFPDDGSSEGNAPFIKTTKTLAELANSKRQVTDIETLSVSGTLDKNVLTDMFNSKSVINLSYDLSLSGASGSRMTVKREDIERLKRSGYSTSIKAAFALIVSLKLETVNDLEFDDIFTMFGKGLENDVLGREEAGEDSDFEKFADLIEKLTLEYLFANNSGFKVNTFLVAEDGDGNKYFGYDAVQDKYTKEIKLKSGSLFNWNRDKTTLGISRTEIKSMFQNYPFIPKLRTVIPGGQNIVVPRNASFTAKAVFVAETKGEFKLWGGEDD